jgi:adenosylcobinamide-phosphate synthase
LLNLVLGGPRSLYTPIEFLHPLHLLEKLVMKASEKLNRFRRSDQSRRMRGLMLVLSIVSAMFFLGAMLQDIFRMPYGAWMEIALLAVLLGARQQLDGNVQIEKLIAHAAGVIHSEVLPAKLVRRQQKEYDSATVIRGSIEAMMVTLSESVIAPLFYYLVVGWSGVLMVSAIAVMDGLLGYRNPQYRDFGTAAAQMHTLVQWLPARITGFLIAIASFFSPACKPIAALRVMFAHAGRTASANAGWPIAATAGALNITLGGPRAMLGSYIADQWIGEGKAQVTIKAIKAARWLFAIVVLFVQMSLLLVAAA